MNRTSKKLETFLKEAIQQRGWSRKELAERAGISVGALNKVLAPGVEIPVSSKFCLKVAAALDEPRDKLLRLAGHLPEGTTAQIQEVQDLAQSLNEERLEMLIQFGRFLLQNQHQEVSPEKIPTRRRPRTITGEF